jgi:hypothetical protein
VTLSATVNCDPGLIGYLTVTVAQSTGSHLAQGSGTSAITCTGADDTISRLVGNSPGVFPYKQGKASASATLTVFDPVTFQSTTSTAGPQEIRVHR